MKVALIVASCLLGSIACVKTEETVKKTLWQVISADSAFTSFKKIMESAPDVVESLKDGDGEYTVFIPTNGAVQDRGTLEDAKRMPTIARYHVVEGTVSIDELEDGDLHTLRTLLTDDRTPYSHMPLDSHQIIQVTNEGKLSSGSIPLVSVTGKTVKCTNGIIHQVNSMMFPPFEEPHGMSDTPYNKILNAVRSSISSRDGLTIFLPSMKAFTAASAKSSVERIARRHVVTGDIIYEEEFEDGVKAKTMDGTKIVVTMKSGKAYVNGVRIVKANIPTNFGIVHVIEGGLETLFKANDPSDDNEDDVSEVIEEIEAEDDGDSNEDESDDNGSEDESIVKDNKKSRMAAAKKKKTETIKGGKKETSKDTANKKGSEQKKNSASSHFIIPSLSITVALPAAIAFLF